VSVPVVAGTCVFLCEPVGTMQPIRMLAPMDKNKDGKFSLEEVKASVPMLRLLERIDDKWGNGDAVVEEAEWEKAFGGFVNKGGLVAIDLHEAGGRVEPQVRWNYRKTVPYVASVLVLENVLYFVQDGGIVTSVDCESGLVSKRQRLKQGGKKFYASPVAADGKILIIDTEGQVAVLRAGSEWEVLTTSSLGEPCFATPAICEGRIYVRTVRTLYCFAESR
jgi:hypothetical protein